MSNMSYCRFENTLSDLQDCRANLDDDDLDGREASARRALIELCRTIVEAARGLDLDTNAQHRGDRR